MRPSAVQNPRGAVGRVAFRGDALVPIVVGSGGILKLDRFQPRILARWLIEVAVNAKIAVFVHAYGYRAGFTTTAVP